MTDPVGTTAALDAALGVEVVVAKERRLFLWRGVRIHLDQIAGLGNFVEFEAVAAAESDLSRERELVSELRATFRIGTGDLLSGSYRDLALAA